MLFVNIDPSVHLNETKTQIHLKLFSINIKFNSNHVLIDIIKNLEQN